MVVVTSTILFSGKISAQEVVHHQNKSSGTKPVSPGSGEPEGDLEAAIIRDFGSVAAMKEKLSASTVAVQV